MRKTFAFDAWDKFLHLRFWSSSVTRLRQHRVAAIVLAVVAFVVVVILGLWHGLQLGTVPAWVSAGGSAATFVSVVLAVNVFRLQQRSETEDQAAQVRLLRLLHTTGEMHEGSYSWWLHIENRSDASVYDIQVLAFRAQVNDKEEPKWLRSISVTELGNLTFLTSALAKKKQIKPDEVWDTQWIADSDQHAHSDRSVRWIQVVVSDRTGRVWLITDHYEPEKIPRPLRPKRHQRKI